MTSYVLVVSCLEDFAPCNTSVRTGSLVEFTSVDVFFSSGFNSYHKEEIHQIITDGHVTGSIFLFKYKQHKYVPRKIEK